MRKLLTLVLGISILVIGLDLARIFWLGKGESPNQAFTNLTGLPPRALANPKANGYFLLLGFATSESHDPVQAGYEMWLEVESNRGHRFFDYSTESRLALQVEDETLEALRIWDAPDAVAQFRAPGHASHAPFTQQALLLDRYRRWLVMSFDDWGYGHPGSPRFVDVFAIHRLYVAEGFSLNVASGLDRLKKDLAAWRTVLAKARTLPLKIMADDVVQDDLSLLSWLLGSRDFDHALLPGVEAVVRPFTSAERSLRWPIQNEFFLSVAQSKRQFAGANESQRKDSDNHKRWVAVTAGLQEDAFQALDASLLSHAIVKGPAQTQKALNLYANYYEAVIKATDRLAGPLPKLHDFAHSSGRTLVDSFLNPIDSVFASGSEPSWEPFTRLLLETDVRLRLASLQARLTQPSSRQPVPARIAQAGPAYYDPFTGFPMLWNAATGRLYSVGKDGRDDGGDVSRDISVAVVLPAAAPAKPPEPATKSGKTPRQR